MRRLTRKRSCVDPNHADLGRLRAVRDFLPFSAALSSAMGCELAAKRSCTLFCWSTTTSTLAKIDPLLLARSDPA